MTVTISSSPQETTVLEFEARKSAAFGVWFQDARGATVNLTGSEIRLTVVNPQVLQVDADYIDAGTGYATFALQASDLDLTPKTYPFVVTLVSSNYSLVVLKGELKLKPNGEVTSTSETFTTPPAANSLLVKLLGSQNVHVSLAAYPPDLVQLPEDRG